MDRRTISIGVSLGRYIFVVLFRIVFSLMFLSLLSSRNQKSENHREDREGEKYPADISPDRKEGELAYIRNRVRGEECALRLGPPEVIMDGCKVDDKSTDFSFWDLHKRARES